jgi:pimeloyl-ACP methyl ester carboxylesterase
MDRSWALLVPFHSAPLRVPGLFIAGRRDPIMGWTGKIIKAMPRTVPDLGGRTIVEAAGH